MRRMFRTMAVVAIVAALSGLPALAGVGGQEPPSKRPAAVQAQLPLVHGVGGAFQVLIEGLVRIIESGRDLLGNRLADAAEKARGVGGQELRGVGGQE
jgi:hypothetical protein